MGFFNKIKDKLGIGGVSIDFTVPSQISREEGAVSGTIRLTTKSEQDVLSVKAILEEEFTQGVGEERGSKTYELGKWSMLESFVIQPGDVKEIPFTISFEELQSQNDNLIARGGAFGALGKLAKMAGREKSEFFVKVDVDVKSAVLDPSERKPVKLI